MSTTSRRLLVAMAALLAVALLQPRASVAEDRQGDPMSPGEAYAAMGFGVFMHYGLATFVGRTPWDYDPHDVAPTVYDPPNFDPDQWMDAIAASGAEYVIFTAKHHDGFVMWPSAYTDWGVETSSDPNTDVVGEVVDAARERGLKVVLYYSWLDKLEPGGRVMQNRGRITDSPAYLTYVKHQLTELLTDYGHIEGIWLDIAPYDEVQLPELADHVHTVSPGTALVPNFPNNLSTPEAADVRSFVDDPLLCDYEGPAEEAYNVAAGPAWWQATDRPPRADTDEIVSTLTYANALGATFSLNVSPGPRGLVPPASVRLLEAVGDRIRGDDLVADAATTASGQVEDHPAGHATDLLANTHWQVPAGSDSGWLQVDLAEPRTIHRTVVQFMPGSAVTDYQLRYLDTAGRWRTAHTGGTPAIPTQTDRFPAVTTSRLRLVMSGDGIGVAELKAYGGIDDTAASYEGTGWQTLAVPARTPPLRSSDGLAGAFNQSVHRSRTTDDTATFAFRGNGVELHTAVGPNQGIARVRVDGGTAHTVDLYRPGADVDVAVFERRDLDPGIHTLTVEVTGDRHSNATDTWVTLDRIVPLAVPPPFDPGQPYEILPDGRLIYDDSGNQCVESAIDYVGTWDAGGATGGYNGTRHISKTAGSYAELSFEGTGVAVLAQTRPGHGIAAISVDGGPAELVDTYSETRHDQVVVWERTDLDPGQHTIRIEVTGEQNPAAHNHWIGLDAIVVTPVDQGAS